jgi:hypothetical protein
MHKIVEPGNFVVIGEDPNFVIENYPNHDPETFIINDLPSYANDSGTVVLLQGSSIMDQVPYNDDWHLSVIDDLNGVSLERIDPSQITFFVPTDESTYTLAELTDILI